MYHTFTATVWWRVHQFLSALLARLLARKSQNCSMLHIFPCRCGPPANLSLGYDFIAGESLTLYTNLFSFYLQSTCSKLKEVSDDTVYLITVIDLIVISTKWTNNVIFISTVFRIPLHLHISKVACCLTHIRACMCVTQYIIIIIVYFLFLLFISTFIL